MMTSLSTFAAAAYHRAKSVLATVQATENLSDSDTPEGLKHTITGRIQALALFWSTMALPDCALQHIVRKHVPPGASSVSAHVVHMGTRRSGA